MAEPPRRSIQLGELPFRIIVFAVTALVVLGMVRLRFCAQLELPAKPPAPEPQQLSVRDVSREVKGDPAAYQGYLAADVKEYGVAATTSETMSKLLAYRLDETRRELDPASGMPGFEAAGLRLTAVVRRIEGRPERMLVLTIENLSNQPVAYRVVTTPDHGTQVCQRKPHLVHNAMALAAGGREERSECIYRNGWTINVDKVETVALTPLGYHYVSLVPPDVVGVEARVAKGHRPPAGTSCNLVLPASIARGRDQGRVSWRDLIDFFARHRCASYSFPEGYRAFARDGEKTLPVMPTP